MSDRQPVADVDELPLERAGADLAEAGRDDDRALEAALAALFHHRRHDFVRHQDHGQIDWGRGNRAPMGMPSVPGFRGPLG